MLIKFLGLQLTALYNIAPFHQFPKKISLTFSTSELASFHLVSSTWPESTVWNEVSVILATPSIKMSKTRYQLQRPVKLKRTPSGNALLTVYYTTSASNSYHFQFVSGINNNTAPSSHYLYWKFYFLKCCSCGKKGRYARYISCAAQSDETGTRTWVTSALRRSTLHSNPNPST